MRAPRLIQKLTQRLRQSWRRSRQTRLRRHLKQAEAHLELAAARVVSLRLEAHLQDRRAEAQLLLLEELLHPLQPLPEAPWTPEPLPPQQAPQWPEEPPEPMRWTPQPEAEMAPLQPELAGPTPQEVEEDLLSRLGLRNTQTSSAPSES